MYIYIYTCTENMSFVQGLSQKIGLIQTHNPTFSFGFLRALVTKYNHFRFAICLAINHIYQITLHNTIQTKLSIFEKQHSSTDTG